jgi:hypothetical protein
MAMVGHKTESIYRRYAIVDEVMLHEGGAKLAAYAEGKVLGKVKGVEPANQTIQRSRVQQSTS